MSFFEKRPSAGRRRKSPPTPPRPAPGPWSFWPGRSFPPGSSMSAWGGSFTQPTAAAVVAEMVERQYVDDERYARTRAHGLLAARKSRRAAAQDLRQKGWTPSRSLLRWKRPTPRTKRAETRSWKPLPPSWKGGTAASWPQGGKTLWWLRWPGGGLHIRLLKKRFGEWKRTVSSLFCAPKRTRKAPASRACARGRALFH